MPGTKTFTDTISNDLLVYDIVAELKSQNEENTKRTTIKIFVEFSKIVLSILIASIISLKANVYEILIVAEERYSLWKMLLGVIILYVMVIILYLILTLIVKLVASLRNYFLNDRSRDSVKKEAISKFRNRTNNLLAYGVSFENKASYGLRVFEGDIRGKGYQEIVADESSLDVIIMFFCRSIVFLDSAYKELHDTIPNEMQDKKEKINAEFLNCIGYSDMFCSLLVARNTIARLMCAREKIEKWVKFNNEDEKVKNAWDTIMMESAEELKELKAKYSVIFDRVDKLNKDYKEGRNN